MKGKSIYFKMRGKVFNLLIMAATKGYKKLASGLLSMGAEVDQKTNTGRTALIVAAASGHSEMVKLFLKRGTNVENKNNSGNTALILVTVMVLIL